MQDLSDGQLVQRIRANDRAAFGELVERYQSRIYGMAYALLGNWAEAQDMTQEAFMNAYLNLHQLKDPEKFNGWLRRKVFGLCMDWHRTFRPTLYGLPSDIAQPVDPGLSPADQLVNQEVSEVVFTALGTLRARYRIPMTLFYLDGQSYEKVADFLGVSVGTVKSQISRARTLMRPVLATYTKEMPYMVKEAFEAQSLPEDFSERMVQFVKGVQRGHTATVQQFLRVDPKWASQPIETLLPEQHVSVFHHVKAELTPLHLAAESDDAETARLLLDTEADPTAKTAWGHTPLEWAALIGSRAVGNVLIEQGSAGLTLPTAAGLGRLDLVQAFFDKEGRLKPETAFRRIVQTKGEPDSESESITDPVTVLSEGFYMAGRNGHIPVTQLLLEKGADLEYRGYKEGTTLQWAAHAGKADMVAWLVDRGAQVAEAAGWVAAGAQMKNKGDADHIGVLRILSKAGVEACLNDWVDVGDLETVKEMVAADPELVRVTKPYGPALCVAVWHGHLEIVRYLLEQGAEANSTNPNGKSVLAEAERKNFTEVAALLREYGAGATT